MAVNCSRIPIRGLLAILFLAAAGPAIALDPSLRLSQYVLDNWQIPDGLPQSSAQAIARTPDGYLWVATQEGLARFNGAEFTLFDKNNTEALSGNELDQIVEDHDGSIWMRGLLGDVFAYMTATASTAQHSAS